MRHLLYLCMLLIPSLSWAAVPTTPILDTFNRTLEDPLTATTWQGASGSTNFKTNGTQAVAATTGSAEARWKTALGSADHEVYVTLAVAPALDGEYAWLAYRGQSSGNTDSYRLFLYRQGVNNRGIYLYKYISSVLTLVASTSVSGVWTAGDTVWVKMEGGVHTIYINGNQVWQWSESGTPAIPAGQYIGFGTNPVTATNIVFDNFGGGSLTTPPGPFPTEPNTSFKFIGEFIFNEIASYITSYPFFSGYGLWPALTTNTVNTVKAGPKELLLFYPAALVPAQDYYNSGLTRIVPTLGAIQTEQAKMIDMTTVAGQRAWWNVMPEWDGEGGHWIQVANTPFTASTRTGMYTNLRNYVSNWTPLWTMLGTPQTTRGYWMAGVTDWVSNVHYSYEWGLDMVLLERAIDELGDIETGIAYMRGAATQYNKPWGIDMSFYRTGANSVSTYNASNVQTGGFSFEYIKRHTYLSYMAGANMIHYEPVNYRHASGVLNPIGTMAQQFAAFTAQHPTRGEAVVPIALLTDFNHGFVPKHWLNNPSNVWYLRLGYNSGDWMTENFFNVAYPGYQSHGLTKPGYSWGDFEVFHQEIVAGLDPRPYEVMPDSYWGDLFDVVLSNATLPALQRYPVVMIMGSITPTAALSTLLTNYVTAGGVLIMASQQAASTDQTLLGVTLTGTTHTATQSKWGAESNVNESPYTYQVVTPGTASVLATNPANGEPLVTSNTVGSGTAYFIAPWYQQNTARTSILTVSRRLMDDLTTTYRQGWVVGAPVDFTTTVGPSFTTVTVSNTRSSTWTGDVKVKQAAPTAAVEWLTNQAVSYSQAGGVTTLTNMTVPAYDVRIFQVSANDVTPPIFTNTTPTTTFPVGTTSVLMQGTSNESATCKFDTTNLAYAAMTQSMSSVSSSHSATISGLTNGSTTTRYVRCSDPAGNAATSSVTVTIIVDTATADTTPPSTVTGLLATATGTASADLSWNAATDNVLVSGYRLYAATGACATYTLAGASITTTTTTVNLTPNTTHCYTIKAIDSSNNLSTSFSNIATITTEALPDTVPPSTPMNLQISAARTATVLNWTPGTDNVSVSVTVIERCTGAVCSDFSEVGRSTVASYVDGSLAATTTYRYRIIHHDTTGNPSVSYSAIVTATTQSGGLDSPRLPATERLAATGRTVRS